MLNATLPNVVSPHRYSGLSEIPSSVVTPGGVVFDPRNDLWSFVDGTKSVYIDFLKMVELGEELRWGLRKTFIWMIENMASGTVCSAFESVCQFCNVVSEGTDALPQTFTAVDLSNARHTLMQLDPRENCFRWCRPFFKRMSKLGFPGISECGKKYLVEMKIRSGANGRATTLLDPIDGPFTDLEREGIFDALYAGYATGTIPLSRYVLAWLVALFGQRPKQYALLKLSDLQIVAEDDTKRYILKIPLVKARNEPERSRFQELDIIPELAMLMLEYKSKMLVQYDGLLIEPEAGPFFPCTAERSADNVKGLEYHMLAVTVTDEIRATFAKLSAISERTGSQMNFNVYRFRRTLGTNCIREGLGIAATALRLGQTTTVSIRPYVALASAFELHDRIEFSTAARLGLIAQSFKGVLVKTVTREGSNPASHISSPIVDSSMEKALGQCGKDDFCSFNKPISCYTCFLFKAWLDAPHQLVYDYLEADRLRLVETGCPPAIVSVNDRAMMAVASVIVQCADEYALRAAAEEAS